MGDGTGQTIYFITQCTGDLPNFGAVPLRCGFRGISLGLEISERSNKIASFVFTVNRFIGKHDAFIPFQQHIVYCLRDLVGHFHIQPGNEYMNGITQGNALRFHNALVSRQLPKLRKVDRDIRIWPGEFLILQVPAGIIPDIIQRGFTGKNAGAIQRLYPFKCLADVGSDDFLRQLDQRFFACLGILFIPIGVDSRHQAFNGAFHLKIKQVLSINDFHAMVSPAVSMENRAVHIPLEFSAIGFQNGALHTA